MAGSTHWSLLSRWLHWLSVPLISWLLWRGWSMVDLPFGKLRFDAINMHKSMGVLLLLLVLIRLLNRLVIPSPASHNCFAQLAHGLLYLCMLGLPISGWLMSNSAGFNIDLFGLVQLPVLAAENEQLSEQMRWLHWALVWLLALLLSGHLAAVIWHQWILKDDTLHNMLPRRD